LETQSWHRLTSRVKIDRDANSISLRHRPSARLEGFDRQPKKATSQLPFRPLLHFCLWFSGDLEFSLSNISFRIQRHQTPRSESQINSISNTLMQLSIGHLRNGLAPLPSINPIIRSCALTHLPLTVPKRQSPVHDPTVYLSTQGSPIPRCLLSLPRYLEDPACIR